MAKAKKKKKGDNTEDEEVVPMTVNTLSESEKVAKSQILSQTRIFTPADFKLINAHQEQKAVTLASRKKTNLKRKHTEIHDANTEG